MSSKYIYPVTRVLSSGINLLFSLVPLVLVMLLGYALPSYGADATLPTVVPVAFLHRHGTAAQHQHDLLPGYPIFMAGRLHVVDVRYTDFFTRRTSFPSPWNLLIKANPLYHVIRLMRSMLMEGISPDFTHLHRLFRHLLHSVRDRRMGIQAQSRPRITVYLKLHR